jgi:hypothetical protein
MSRVTNALLPNGQGFAQGRQAPMLDPIYGGQQGFAPEYSEWVSNKAYIQRNMIALLIEAPTGFQLLNNPDKWVGTLRALVERQAIRITGLQSGLEVETAETSPVGGGGEMHEDFTNVTRARSQPVFTWNEKEGRPVAAFLEGWVTNLMMDPETKVAGVATTGNKPGDMLPDRYSMTVLFIEPDILHTKVINAWLCTNMYPKGNVAEVTGRRDKAAAGEPVNYDVNFTSITQHGLGVRAFAQAMLDSISLTNANPSFRPAFVQALSADVSSANVGYAQQAQNMGNTAVRV